MSDIPTKTEQVKKRYATPTYERYDRRKKIVRDLEGQFDAWLNHERAEVLREFAKKVYNGAPASRDANFQAFYNEGLHPVLMAEADRIEFGLEWEE